ncbi:hypothetical protein MMPV_007638 [Pyropia vietnamensis]
MANPPPCNPRKRPRSPTPPSLSEAVITFVDALGVLTVGGSGGSRSNNDGGSSGSGGGGGTAGATAPPPSFLTTIAGAHTALLTAWTAGGGPAAPAPLLTLRRLRAAATAAATPAAAAAFNRWLGAARTAAATAARDGDVGVLLGWEAAVERGWVTPIHAPEGVGRGHGIAGGGGATDGGGGGGGGGGDGGGGGSSGGSDGGGDSRGWVDPLDAVRWVSVPLADVTGDLGVPGDAVNSVGGGSGGSGEAADVASRMARVTAAALASVQEGLRGGAGAHGGSCSDHNSRDGHRWGCQEVEVVEVAAHAASPGVAPNPSQSPAFLLNAIPRDAAGALRHTTRLSSLIPPGLTAALLTSFVVDTDFLLTVVPALTAPPAVGGGPAAPVLLVAGGGGVPPDVAAALPPNVTVHSPRMRSPYGVHHAKVSVLFYGDAGVRGVYCRDFPRRTNDAERGRPGDSAGHRVGSRQAAAAARSATTDAADTNPFGADLGRYLSSLGPPAAPYARLLASYDLSTAGVDLVTSVPGSHTGAARDAYGHLRLRRLLAGAAPPAGAPRAVVQVSSIGGLSPAWVAQFGESLHAASPPPPLTGAAATLAAAAAAARPQLSRSRTGAAAPSPLGVAPIVAWPSVGDVRGSPAGYLSGTHLFARAAVLARPAVATTLCRYQVVARPSRGSSRGGSSAGAPLSMTRAATMPHLKTYTRPVAAGAGSPLAWVLLTSANLSIAAWGTIANSGAALSIASYEAGVLFTPRRWCPPAHDVAVAMGMAGGVPRPLGATSPPHPPGRGPPAGVATASAVPVFIVHPAFAGRGRASSAPADGAAVVEFPLAHRLDPPAYAAGGDCEQPWAHDVPHDEVDAFGRVWPLS